MDDDSVLIEPRRIPGDPRIDHPIILNLFEPYFDYLRKELRVKKPSLKRLRFPSMTCCSAAADGKEISIFGTPLGAPQAAMVLGVIPFFGIPLAAVWSLVILYCGLSQVFGFSGTRAIGGLVIFAILKGLVWLLLLGTLVLLIALGGFLFLLP